MNENEINVTTLGPDTDGVRESNFLRNAIIGGAAVLVIGGVICGVRKLIKKRKNNTALVDGKEVKCEIVDCEEND